MAPQSTRTTAVLEPTERELTDKEKLFAEFESSLTAWQLHKLHNIGELELHDQYVAGEMELVDIFLMVCVKGEEGTYP